MLPTLNIPSTPLPEVPSAQPVAPGDAGERAEFAQLLQQAKAVDAEGAADEPTVRSAKDARTDTRVRPGTTRPAQDHKAHDARRARAEAEPIDADGHDIDPAAACLAHAPATDAAAIAIDAAAAPPTPKQDDTPAVAPDAAALPWPMRHSEPLPEVHARVTPEASAATLEERSTGTRLGARGGVREMRLPTRADGHGAAAADTSAARALPAPDITLPQAKEASPFELALRATGRGAGAPLFDRMPSENSAAAAQALAFARELQQPLAARTEASAEAALHAAPDEAGLRAGTRRPSGAVGERRCAGSALALASRGVGAGQRADCTRRPGRPHRFHGRGGGQRATRSSSRCRHWPRRCASPASRSPAAACSAAAPAPTIQAATVRTPGAAPVAQPPSVPRATAKLLPRPRAAGAVRWSTCTPERSGAALDACAWPATERGRAGARGAAASALAQRCATAWPPVKAEAGLKTPLIPGASRRPRSE